MYAGKSEFCEALIEPIGDLFSFAQNWYMLYVKKEERKSPVHYNLAR